jgi:NADH dehydrogenase
MGTQAANTVLSRIAGEQPAAINQGFYGSCISLGRRTAIFQVARRDDTPLNILIAGRVGAALKEAICKSTLWGIRREATKPGSAEYWRKGGQRPTGGEFSGLTSDVTTPAAGH